MIILLLLLIILILLFGATAVRSAIGTILMFLLFVIVGGLGLSALAQVPAAAWIIAAFTLGFSLVGFVAYAKWQEAELRRRGPVRLIDTMWRNFEEIIEGRFTNEQKALAHRYLVENQPGLLQKLMNEESEEFLRNRKSSNDDRP